MPQSGRQIHPRESPEKADGVLQVVPRSYQGLALLQLREEIVHRLDIIRDLSNTEIVRTCAGLVEVVSEGRSQLQKPVMISIDVDQMPLGTFDVVDYRIQDSAQLLRVNRERSGA